MEKLTRIEEEICGKLGKKKYGVYPIIKQKVCERDLSREWICTKPYYKTPQQLENPKIKHSKVRKLYFRTLEFENVL